MGQNAMTGKTLDPYMLNRIVCLSPDLVSTLYALGCAGLIVGKPEESELPGTETATVLGRFARTSDESQIVALNPDLVIGFSSTCDKVMSRLIAANINVLALHYSNLDEIYRATVLLGNLLGKLEEAAKIVSTMKAGFSDTSAGVPRSKPRPKVYFEEWDKPHVCGLEWISEIISIAGGVDVFASRCQPKKFMERIITTDEVVAAAPDIILASWCGKPFTAEAIKNREGWNQIPAVVNNRVYEIPADIILRPGLALIEGARYIRQIIFGKC